MELKKLGKFQANYRQEDIKSDEPNGELQTVESTAVASHLPIQTSVNLISSHKRITAKVAPSSPESHVPHTEENRSRYCAEFQPYLNFVSFPDLEEVRRRRCAKIMRDLFGQEVLYVIKWLRLVKGVKKIIRLKVLDSRYEPHKEEVIEEAIKDVDVEELDWRRLDLSIRTVQAAAANVKTPHLYSGGDWASICHWMSENGINRLKVVFSFHP
jgi:hypothetical protein